MINKNIRLQPGQAEELVKLIRHHLREAELHAQHDNWIEEERERKLSDDTLEILLKGLKGKFSHYAHRFFGNKSHTLMEDLTQEMVYGTIKEVRRTDNTAHSLLYENKFNLAIEGCINNVLDFFKTEKAGYNDGPARAYLQEQAERRKEGIEDSSGSSNSSLPLSLNSLIAGDDEAEEHLNTLPDSLALLAVQNVLTHEIWAAFVIELTAQDKVLAEAVYSGQDLQDAAKLAGIPLRTAHNRKKEFCNRLLELFGLAQEPGDFVDEANSEFKLALKTKKAPKKRKLIH
ncbi:MAG TPA: hypothetical protein VF627_09165 [Abditibacterium sp.]|jgi:hypothetical protein